MSGSSTGMSCTRELPSSLHHGPGNSPGANGPAGARLAVPAGAEEGSLVAATVAMATLVTAFSLFTDALRDALDPKLKGL